MKGKLEKEEDGIRLFSLGDPEWKEVSGGAEGDSKKRDEIKAVLAEGEAREEKAATRSEKREVQRYSRTEFA